MKLSPIHVSALTLALALAGCATDGAQPDGQAKSGAVQTEEKAAVNPQGTAATQVSISTVTGTVEAIDLDTRMVTIVGPQGTAIVLQAGEQVRNLAQVKAGDKVTLEYYEGVVADLRSGAAARQGGQVMVTEAMERAAMGDRPAAALGNAVRATVEIQFVDTLRNVVHFKGPLGKTRIVKVMKPEFQAMLKNVKVGDLVDLTFFEALAVAVTPASN